MASSPRIDELRKKFDENPRRYFAPLANEYRKAGDFQQAIAICREYLPQQPGHMSGHIVFGQALYEARQFDEAKTVFETALSLDPENLIALKHLGDIALIIGDTETARSWYKKILDADPRNEEILAQIAKLEQKAQGAKIGATMVMQAVPRPGTAPKAPSPPKPTPAAPAAPARPAPPTPPAGTPVSLSNQKTSPIPLPNMGGGKTEPMPAVTPPAPAAATPAPPAVPSPPPAPAAPPPALVTADSPTQEIRLDTIPTHAPPTPPPAVEMALGLEPTSFGAATPPPSGGPTLEIDTPVSASREAPPVGGFRLEGLETTSLDASPPAPPLPPPAPTAPATAASADVLDLDISIPAPAPASAPPAPAPAPTPPAAAAADLVELDISIPAAPPPAPAIAQAAPAEETIDLSFAPPAVPASPPPPPPPPPAPPTADLPLLDLGDMPAAPPAPPAPAPAATQEVEMIDLGAPPSPEPPTPPAAAPPAPPVMPMAPAPIAEAVEAPAPSAFVTETMAELYLQQGHRDEALKVYRALLEKRPDDAALLAKVASLSAPPAPAPHAGPTIRELLYVIAARRPGYRADLGYGGNGTTAQAATPPSALVADGLAYLLGNVVVTPEDEWAAQSLATAFLSGNDNADELSGAPAHPAAGDLSLKTVFAASGDAPPAAAPASNFSFDQFFSQRATADNPAIPAVGEHPASESQEDVAHFTQWLEGLKKK